MRYGSSIIGIAIVAAILLASCSGVISAYSYNIRENYSSGLLGERGGRVREDEMRPSPYKEKGNPIRQDSRVRMNYDVVKPGDTIWTIAARNNVTVDTVLGCNIISHPTRLVPGTVLKLPNRNGVLHLATKETTISKLAEYYDISEQELRDSNGFDPTLDKPGAGKYVFIPGEHSSGKTLKATKFSKRAQGVFGYKIPPLKRIFVTSPYGYRKDPFTGRRQFHTGIDLRAPTGTEIRAVMGGIVVYAGYLGGYGRTVIVDHGEDLETLYGHCSLLMVRRGDMVRAGQTIALAGDTGRSLGAHLHFEVRSNGRHIDPKGFLEKGEVAWN